MSVKILCSVAGFFLDVWGLGQFGLFCKMRCKLESRFLAQYVAAPRSTFYSTALYSETTKEHCNVAEERVGNLWKWYLIKFTVKIFSASTSATLLHANRNT